MLRGRWTITFVAIPGLAACAAASAGRRSPGQPVDYDTLTSKELATLVGAPQNAYSAVEQLRPLYLATRPGVSALRGVAPRLHVFVNGSYAGDVEVLKMIPFASVESIRHVRATVAFTQYGEIHSGDGVLMVRLR